MRLSLMLISTLMLMSPAFANTVEPKATPEITPPITQTTCANGAPTWEEGRAEFDVQANKSGGFYAGKWVSPEDGSFAIFYDFRGAPDVDPTTPFFILAFDPEGCYVLAVFSDEQTIQDTFGITFVKN